MILFFDTETTGLPNNWGAPITQVYNWPRLVQIAWLLYDRQYNLVSVEDHIIKPDNFTIPAEATAIHGITTETAIKKGNDLASVLLQFSKRIDESTIIIAHNVDFDTKVIGAEFYRLKISSRLFDIKRLCTMRTTADLCKIPGSYGYKYPKLTELHQYLFGSEFTAGHNALIDVMMCSKCFFELEKRGYYKLD